MKIGVFALLTISWASLWYYPDQLGQRLFLKGEYELAASRFLDAQWKASAEYKAGNFEAAAQYYARSSTPEALYNQGNAWVFLGKYEQAIACYDLALEKRPDWTEAQENRELARLRAEKLESPGGDMTDGQLPPDEIVFDDKKGDDEQTVAENTPSEMSEAEIQALWLKRVQTKPADFLKAKFAYQLGNREEPQESP